MTVTPPLICVKLAGNIVFSGVVIPHLVERIVPVVRKRFR
jgi:ABC-type Fe3+-siderophore transport system permease subunit